MTTPTTRDEELARLLDHDPTDDNWKPVLFTIAGFREETERLIWANFQQQIYKSPEELARALLDKTKAYIEPKTIHGIVWASFTALQHVVKSTSIERAMSDADILISGYLKRYGK